MKKSSLTEVKQYYDKVTDKYLEVYGEVIQAFRPKRTDGLLDYLIESSGLKHGMKVIDAGCGVCGPSIYFAKHMGLKIDALTISPEQVRIGREKIKKAKQRRKINMIEGDYHQLSNYFPDKDYNAVLFLESLGHSPDPKTAINEAAARIKPGGFIYIKDFFLKQSYDPVFQERINQVVDNINVHYSYNTLDLEPVLQALRGNDLEIQFIKKFDFDDDITVRAKFEEDLGFDIFGDLPEFHPAEWLEIKCVKPLFE